MLEGIKWIVYRHISPSGKVYVGITKNSTVRRWGPKGGGYKNCPYFMTAINKYGWDSFIHEIVLEERTESEAKYAEKYLIRWYKMHNMSYNITDGGDGTLGWHPSEELCKQWGKKRKGRIITEEWRKHLSESGKRNYRNNITPYVIQRAAEVCSKEVVQFSLSGEYLNTFSCIKEAARKVRKADNATGIGKCCKGLLYSAYGYLWMYKDDYTRYIKQSSLDPQIALLVQKNKNKGYYERTEKWRKKVSDFRKGKKYNSPEFMKRFEKIGQEACKKCVLQSSLKDVPIAVFQCTADVHREFGYSKSAISGCCNGKRTTANGFKWKFITKEEYEQYKLQLAA